MPWVGFKEGSSIGIGGYLRRVPPVHHCERPLAFCTAFPCPLSPFKPPLTPPPRGGTCSSIPLQPTRRKDFNCKQQWARCFKIVGRARYGPKHTHIQLRHRPDDVLLEGPANGADPYQGCGPQLLDRGPQIRTERHVMRKRQLVMLQRVAPGRAHLGGWELRWGVWRGGRVRGVLF